jgi:hypothetical protein
MNGLLLLGAREGRQRQVRGVVWCGGEATVQPRRTGTAGNCSSHHRPTRHGSLARFLPACSAVPWGGRPAVTAGLSRRLTSKNLAIQRHGVGRPLPLLGVGCVDWIDCSARHKYTTRKSMMKRTIMHVRGFYVFSSWVFISFIIIRRRGELSWGARGVSVAIRWNMSA